MCITWKSPLAKSLLLVFSLAGVMLREMGIWVIALEISFVPTKSHKELICFIFFVVVAILTPYKPCLHYNACKLLQ